MMSILKGFDEPCDLLRVTAPAKINLHLEVLGLRADGFHELAMVMQSVDLADELELSGTKDGVISLVCDDPSLSTDDDNLIIRAAKLLKDRSGISELGVSIGLQKRIPIGAGLAGGSSDAAATLAGLNSLWGLQFSEQKLEGLASQLGSDVPFCLAGGTQLCFGRGERLEPLRGQGASMAVLLVKNPSVSVSTPWAYERCRSLYSRSYLKHEAEFEKRRQLLREEFWLVSSHSNESISLRNDLQKVVAPVTPSVQEALGLLASLPGSLAVAMSGSGPSCFALYSDLEGAKLAQKQLCKDFFKAGLKSWCCSFSLEGAKLKL